MLNTADRKQLISDDWKLKSITFTIGKTLCAIYRQNILKEK